MKRILLASAACFALSLPAAALAQTNNAQPNPPPQSQSQATNPSANQQQAQMIEPSKLSKEQIREIQMKLNKDGFSSGHVDGVWGPDTDKAVMDFQKAKNLPGDGKLNQQTLADLGVKLNNQSTAASNKNETTGSMANKNETGKNKSQAKTNEQSLSRGTTTNSGSKTGTNTKTTP